MIVTTARKGADQLIPKAVMFAEQVNGRFVKRDEQSVDAMIEKYGEHVLIVGKGKITLYHQHYAEPFFYHPNSAMFRVKQYKKTNYDPLIETAQLATGMHFLDCTLGLASDSLVAQIAVGKEGKVVGLEANPHLAYLVKYGLKSWLEGTPDLIEAMRAIEVIHTNHLDYLKEQKENAFDVIYFDPMFENTVTASKGIQGLKAFACQDTLSNEIINEALRVATKRVVLKDDWQSKRFGQFGFTVMRRQHASFHYGYIQV
ncbi:class I SAM-dependent methyltransferase [Bacillus solitudinis]|uniref:class I SAM-dependent methyltransferase n=1 Tax=Bacillus solitudinis TaxID=2014074 RepID=UPI000C24B8BA|nr:class I SAM-dependent methyltransferase [Bacillus solitudinis]